ncbi:ammonium transporter [Novosphingobium sp.]|uniref:ammonium transporter n=1 Tax=Novosphingobium sp. TaxID=1874826 RepID=UPI0022C3DFD2|nr:ammonium transporter [Novosphingobium sp.]MCZ8017414.1 ammonium transporter [Novosphingobium sp.]MCZ8034063.1 ammonium transporter [Novosphingobium sp.]MCZ8051418.1 ammonium transporter [Novosphingobium sp.]MCZ8059764.1 ammonium transporter [Novosphingobium sp.]MCZ8231602.1 ammonium transporter [Novosphingobium sp.]
MGTVTRMAVTATALLAASPALAQELVPGTLDTGDTAWILTSAALVLFMTMPGLALFYGGLVRARNFLSVLVQVGAIAAMASVLWIVAGYTLAFGDVTSGWLGAGNAWMLIGTEGLLRGELAISERTFALFQLTFAAITPALMAGAWVDRARFGWVVGFCALWGLIVYAPVAHWVWGNGWLATTIGTLDFAGGIVVHTTAGISALVVALLLGKRQGFPRTLMLPHSPALTMAGAAMLWVGWFGFNGGSALAASDDAASAIINTHLAASVAALVWLLIERISVGKPTSVGFATGAIAGLATVTPAAGLISPGAAIIFGTLAALVCYPMIQLVKQKLQIDDSLDVFAVHGVGGITGSLLLGVFLSADLGGSGYAEGIGMINQVAAQAVGVGVVALWSAIASAVIAVLVSLAFPMRISEDDEREGLDITSHGERAWELD